MTEALDLGKLLPCPFCGKRPAYDHTRTDGVRFSCLECEEAAFEDFEEAAVFWNTRAALSNSPLGEGVGSSQSQPGSDGERAAAGEAEQSGKEAP